MFIGGIVFCIIVAVIIILVVTSKVNTTGETDKKKEFAIPPQRRYPIMYFRDCHFYADAVSRFEYSDEEIDQFLNSLDGTFEKEEYDKVIQLSNEIIKILPKSDKAWFKKIHSIFGDVIKNEKCWTINCSKVVINACFGFLQCYDNVIEKSMAAKHILVPMIVKNIDSLIKYQNENVTKYHNLEVYNMLLNLYYILPYRDFLTLLTNSLLQDKADRDFEEDPYVRQTIRNLLKQSDMLRTKSSSKLQETFDNNKITNCTLITDERIGGSIIAFELIFQPGEQKEKLEICCYDENADELHFGNNLEDRYVEVFESNSSIKSVVKEEIVLLTDENISKVILRICKDKTYSNVKPLEKNNEIESPNNENEEKKTEEKSNEEIEDFEPQHRNDTPQMLMYPSFQGIETISISDTQFVGLKENGTVITLGIGDKLKQQTNTWKNIVKVYVKNDAVYGVREDGTVIYAGNSDYKGAEYIYSLENVESLSLGEKHIVAITKNSTTHALGDNSNGECEVEGWYDIIQVETAYHTVGLCKNGMVLATGENNFGECNVKSWKDIVQIAVGDFYTLGLTASGKVLATGLNSCGQCNVDEWANIKKIYANGNMSVGLRYDGKVVTAGKNAYHYGDIKNWTRIRDIAMTGNKIVGVEQDGSVRATGKPYRNFVNGEWTDIKDVAISNNNIVGLKENGTLISNGLLFGYCISDNFENVAQISEEVDTNRIAMLSDNGVVTINDKIKNTNSTTEIYPTFYEVKKIALSKTHLVMLKNDGKAEYFRFSDGATDKILDWENLVDVEAGKGFLVGLNISGKVMATGENEHGQCEVSEWHDIVKIKAAEKRAIGMSIDGRLYMSGVSEYGEDDFIKLFKNVKDFALTNLQTMILESDGTVKVTYHPDGADTEKVKEWKNIKKVVARGNNFLCLSEEGKVYSTIENEAEIGEWEEIDDIDASATYVWATLKK